MLYAAVMFSRINMLIDAHLLGASSVLVLALTMAGDIWGFGDSCAGVASGFR
jgi:hypothetical protein